LCVDPNHHDKGGPPILPIYHKIALPKGYLSIAFATLARQAAVKAVKRQLQAQGIKVPSLSAKDIRALADDYLGQHRERLVAEAKQIVATSPLFERCRWPVANIASDAQTEERPKSITSAVQISCAK
jgi:hypothetical protein